MHLSCMQHSHYQYFISTNLWLTTWWPSAQDQQSEDKEEKGEGERTQGEKGE